MCVYVCWSFVKVHELSEDNIFAIWCNKEKKRESESERRETQHISFFFLFVIDFCYDL
jgi:hypothetical protein